METMRFTANQARQAILIGKSIALLLVFTTSVYAQPEVTLKFESTFGVKEPYIPGVFGEVNINPPKGFISPTGIAFLSSDRLIVADRGNLKLQSCDDKGSCFWFGGDASPGQGGGNRNTAGTFDLPHGVSVMPGERIIVADEDNHMLQLCDSSNNCTVSGNTTSQNTACTGSLGKWCSPQDVASDSTGRVYGLDTGNDRIQILRADDLAFRDVFMKSGSALGQINGARGMAIDKDDRVIISDTGNNRIQICDIDENCTAFGSMGSAVGQFNAPVGIDVDALGRIWIADTGNNRIQVCDYNGGCVAFGGAGTGNGQFDQPHDVAVHSSGRVAVVDTANHRIQLFSTEMSFTMNAGLNDAWYYPETGGQGFFITVFPDKGEVSLAWFTYDTVLPPMNAVANLGDPGHRWLTALGTIDGNQALMQIEMTSGGIFDESADVTARFDGTIKLSFESCSKGLVEYDIPSINQQGSVPIQRIAKDNVALCESL